MSARATRTRPPSSIKKEKASSPSLRRSGRPSSLPDSPPAEQPIEDSSTLAEDQGETAHGPSTNNHHQKKKNEENLPATATSTSASLTTSSCPLGTSMTTSSSAATSSLASSFCPRMDQIYDSILEAIGGTPCVRLNKIGPSVGLACELVVKCEYMNAGGSVKDRIGIHMVQQAEQSGQLKTGDTLIEPTSGNTGIGLALCAAVKGYRCIITMPEKMSKEKVDVLKALQAEIIRTPTEAVYDAPDSHISVAKRLQAETPRSHILDQYANPANPGAHYQFTAQEIWRQCQGKVDMIVAGAGTGGTITGLAQRFRELNPNCIMIGVDPVGSILAVPDSLNDEHRLESYLVEGIGYDFIPQVLKRELVHKWYKSNDRDSLLMMRRLIAEEGLLCGGSSGGAVAVALQAAADFHLRADQRVVIILPDSVRNYMTKALSDDWMSDHGFVDGQFVKAKNFSHSWWATKKVYELPTLATPLTITANVSCREAIALLKQEGFDMVPVLDEQGAVMGVVTEGNMTQRILAGRCAPDDSVQSAGVMYKTFHQFTMQDTLSELAKALDHDPFVLIVTEQRCYSGQHGASSSTSSSHEAAGESAASLGPSDPKKPKLDSSPSQTGGAAAAADPHKPRLSTRRVVSGIVSRIDLLDYISSGGAAGGKGAAPGRDV